MVSLNVFVFFGKFGILMMLMFELLFDLEVSFFINLYFDRRICRYDRDWVLRKVYIIKNLENNYFMEGKGCVFYVNSDIIWNFLRWNFVISCERRK